MSGLVQDITERKRSEETLRQSEERFRVLFEQAADSILLLEITPEGIPVIRDANSATFGLLGFERDELIGQPVSFIEAAPEPFKVVDKRRQKILLGIGKMFEAKHRCKDGTIRDFECSVTEMQIGSKTFAISVERDITERKRIEEALRKSEERLQLAVNATEDGIWEWDIQTNQEFFSPRWCEIIGYSFDDPELPHTYKSWAERIHPDDHDRVISALNNHLAKGTKYDVEYLHRHKSGEYRWQNSTGRAVFDESGKPTRMVGCISDITERKQAEEKLAEQLDELRRWHDVMLGREDRVQELKREVNELCRRLGEMARYSSQEAGPTDSDTVEPKP